MNRIEENCYLFCLGADFLCVFLRIILFLAHYPPESVSVSRHLCTLVFLKAELDVRVLLEWKNSAGSSL